MQTFLRFRWGRVLGLVFFIAGLSKYRSYESTPIFGAWSWPFFGVILTASVLLVFVIVRSLTVPSQSEPPSDGCRSVERHLLDLALLFWGSAYLLSATDSPASGGRVADLNFFGSVMPAAALLEWVALVFLLLGVGVPAIPRLKDRSAKALLTVGAILVATLVSEGAARVKVAIAPATLGYPSYSSDVWGRRYLQLNGDGWRDAEHSVSSDAGTRRLLVVGDSVAFGWGIPRVEDRLGEQLVSRLERLTAGTRWESLNASRPDSHTLDEIGFLQRMAIYKPDVVLLIYVFNDIDYLAPATRREHSSSFLAQLRPDKLVYRNSYLFQEIFVRFRQLYYGVWAAPTDPYEDVSLVSRHLVDLARFVAIASETGATVRVVPFDHPIVLDRKRRERYLQFVQRARGFGVPICSLDKTFDGFRFRGLTVNALDLHPNETANHLAAGAVADCLAQWSPDRR